MNNFYFKQTFTIPLLKLLNQAGLRRHKNFAIGFNKCGTSSLHYLFKSLGLPSYHNPKWTSCDNQKLLRKYDCFSDGAPDDLAKLDHLFPGSKFILQVRELESWIYSRLAHIERSKELGKYHGRPEWDNTEYAVKIWIKQRNDYHRFVLSYFSERPSDILIVNFIRDDSAATKVCNFLGYKGEFTRPKKNAKPRKERPLQHKRMIINCITELGIPKRELKYDLFCPSLLSDESCVNFPSDSSMFEMKD